MVDEYNRKNDTVYKCTYHIIFCPKYRRSILKDGIDKLYPLSRTVK